MSGQITDAHLTTLPILTCFKGEGSKHLASATAILRPNHVNQAAVPCQGGSIHEVHGDEGDKLYNVNWSPQEDAGDSQEEKLLTSGRSSHEAPLGGVVSLHPSEPYVLVQCQIMNIADIMQFCLSICHYCTVFCAWLCSAALRCAVLCCAVLCCAVLCGAVQRYTKQ